MGILIIGRTERGWFGANAAAITAEEALELNYPELEGVIIKGIEKDSPAKPSGLKINDVITQFNKMPITNLAILRRKLLALTPRPEIHLTLFRDGETFEITSTLTRKKTEEEIETQPTP